MKGNSVIIGLTGIWGAGKTTVLKIFKSFGATVINADDIVHTLLQRDDIKNKIIKYFGKDYINEGKILKRKLAKQIFYNEKSRNILEGIIHPEVFYVIEKFIKEASGKIKIIEIPLLFETKTENYFDEIIVVKAGIDNAIERLSKKGYTKEDVKKRLALQMSEEQKIKKAHRVIDNSGSINKTKQEVRKIWEDLLKK